MLLLFDDNKVKMARKSGKKQKENPVAYTGKENIKEEIREGYREEKTGIACI